MLTVILTGGASRRMGRDKAMLPWDGKTLLQTLIDRYSAALGPVVVSVNERGRFDFTGAEEAPDRYPNLGPLNGIIAAFENTAEDAALLTATDLPFGDPALAVRLHELCGEHDACVMHRGVKGTEPLFAVYRRTCLGAALECLAEGKKSFKELFSRIDLRLAEPEELRGFDLEHILMNVNTAEEYDRALEK